MSEEFFPGDKVIVPWGLDEVAGEVVSSYPTGFGQRLVVRIEIPGSTVAEDTSITLPASAVSHALSNETPAASGSWAPSLHYERSVFNALIRVSPAVPRLSRSEWREVRGGPVDFVARLDMAHRLLVEVKYRTDRQISEDVIMSLAKAGLSYDEDARMLLVTNTSLSPQARAVLAKLGSAARIKAVTWRDHEDDSILRKCLVDLLPA